MPKRSSIASVGAALVAALILNCHCFSSVGAFSPLNGVAVTSVQTGSPVDLGTYLSTPQNDDDDDGHDGCKTMLILGTYAADFNAVEYAQRLRYYLPKLKECGITKFGLVLNCQPDAAKTLVECVDLDMSMVDLLVDPKGDAGRAFGVERGWLPENDDVNPFVKLFGMLWGLGAWATLPAVIGGYIGNPFVAQPWIEDALAVGQRQGRWPNTALDLSDDGSMILQNKFEDLPFVGEWKRRPLELATLRLQSMLGISLSKWDDLKPDEGALSAGVLTQLGGCIIVDSKTGDAVFEWRDPGICAVANFEDILKKLSTATSS